MAIIGEIQKRIWIVFVFIAIALVGFLIMDSTQSAGRSMDKGNKTEFARIGDTELTPEEYNNAIARAQNDYLVRQQRVVDARQGNFRLDEATAFTLSEQAWDQLVNDKLLQNHLEAANLVITDDEFANMIYGLEPHPYIAQLRQALPQFGIDPNQPGAVQQFVQLVSNTQQWQQFPILEQYYRDFLLREQSAREEVLESKYTNLFQKSAYTPTWMAKRDHQMQNTRLSLNYIVLPFRDIPDEEVSFTEQEVEAKYRRMQKTFSENQESRNIEYISFDVVATPEDSQAVMDKLMEYKAQWLTETDDSAFLSLYSQDQLAYTNAWFRLDDLYSIMVDSSLAREMFAMPANTYSAPYLEGGAYKIAKSGDRDRYPDSTSVRHIFLRLDEGGNTAALQTRIDSLYGLLQSGVKTFEELAAEFSDDENNRNNGGDLGWINPNTPFFPELRDFVYQTGQVGKPAVVVSPIGYHIMEVVEKRNVHDFVKFSFLSRDIRPSRSTDDVAFDKAENFYEKFGNDEAFDQGVTEMGYQKRISGTFRQNQFAIVNLPQSRPVIDWAFNAEKGDVQMFHLPEKHIVVRLREKTVAGPPDLETMRTQVEAELINEKKTAQLFKKVEEASAGADGDLAKIASNLGVQVSSSSNATFGSNFIPQLGGEPEVLGLAFGMDLNKVSPAIAGKQGVFVIQPTEVQQADELPDYTQTQQRLNNQERNRYSLNSMLEAFKKQVEIIDNHHLFN